MRRIAVVTTSRADYGIYRSLLRRLAEDTDIELQLIVAGMHLAEEFGHTVDAIEADGFVVTERIDMLEGDDSPKGVATAMGRGCIGYGEAFARLRPDIIVVLGDRFEMFAAAVAAQPFTIPLAHIHGGELTLGAMDDALRHAMTKLSHLHFVSTDDYARRVRQMGEEDWRVTVSGAPGLDNLGDLEIADGAALEKAIGMSLSPAPLMVTYHPVTHEPRQLDAQAAALFAAIEASGLPAVFTAPNADEGGRRLGALMRAFVTDHPDCRFVDNLGTRAWFGLMKSASAMVGNSSSGIIEA
ncbi:MAG: UDP-N-acetylglucosamine 2-epimerase, partial [Alphaproteobacteria bacterium]